MAFEDWPWAAGPATATIYARSALMGDGSALESQIHRCRAHAERLGLTIETVFTDYGSGDVALLSGMASMMNFIRLSHAALHVVIVDNISRLGRNLEANARLRQRLEEAGVELIMPQAPMLTADQSGVIFEGIMAAMAQLVRQNNRLKVIERQKALLKGGYYVFSAPHGYEYQKINGQKLLVPRPPLADIVRDAIEGFAIGHFESKSDVRRFLENQHSYPKCNTAGHVRNGRVDAILTNPLYAGYIEWPSWQIPLTKGKHQGLVSLRTYSRAQKRLAGWLTALSRPPGG